LDKLEIKNKQQIDEILANLEEAHYTIANLETKEVKKIRCRHLQLLLCSKRRGKNFICRQIHNVGRSAAL